MKKPSSKAEHASRMRAWYARNREKIRKKRRDYIANLSEEEREELRRYQRNFQLSHRYGITEEDYDKMLLQQRGTCALCDRLAADERTGRLNVDHDHKTNKVRGLLCRQCNVALGQLGDSPQGLLRAFLYVVKHVIH